MRRSGEAEVGKKSGVLRKLLCSGEQERVVGGDGVAEAGHPPGPTLETLAVNGYASATTELSSRVGDCRDIEEAESSLRDGGCLNHEEARALLGKIEYQKGNVEAALHVFEGINVTNVCSKIKLALAGRDEYVSRRKSKNYSKRDSASHMSIPSVSLILDAIYLKAKSLQALGRIKEAAQTCKVILDVIESSLPAGLPENIGGSSKLQETVNKAVELLPELWKFSECPDEAILSYRRGLLYRWNLNAETLARIEKEFAVFLLYSGGDASPPYLLSQLDASYVPRNNMEEAILLLKILVRKMKIGMIKWDASVLDHLSYGLSVSGEMKPFAKQLEELLPGTIDSNDWYYTVALCYYGSGEGLVARDLLKKLLHSSQDPNHVAGLLLASKICGEHVDCAEEGLMFSQRALENLNGKCAEMISLAHYLRGISLSALSSSLVSGSEKDARLSEALQALDLAGKTSNMENPMILYHLSLQNAEARNLKKALYHAKQLLKLDAWSDIQNLLLLARILSAQKRFADAEAVIDAALDETVIWEQVELLRSKAKLQLVNGNVKRSLDTYAQVMGVLQAQRRNFEAEAKLPERDALPLPNEGLEFETWYDLASIYTDFSKFDDAEFCLSKAKAICPHSASQWHMTGKLHEAKGAYKEALAAYQVALSLDLDSTHVPSLISIAMTLRRLSYKSHALIRSFMLEALKHDRMNHTAWYSLGLVYKDQGTAFCKEAAECFQAAYELEETSPVEPFR